MGPLNFRNDKSWLVIAGLVMFAPPIGIVALVAKILYMVYVNRIDPDDLSRSADFDSRPTTNGFDEDRRYRESIDLEESLSSIEDELKDAFTEWKETQSEETASYKEGIMVAEVMANKDIDLKKVPGDQGLRDDLMNLKSLDVDHLEDQLNASLEALKVAPSVEVDTDVDLTFVDVHIDTEITFDNEPEDHDHEGERPLKVITCTMCHTENRIYKIDIFETPCCEKCGMLLLDRT